MSVSLVPAIYADVVYIARRMRKRDAEEIFPLTWSGRPEDLAVASVAGGISTVALSGDVPVAAWGAIEGRPCFWNVWMFATDRWPEVALSVTRHINREMMPAMINAGAVRADCWSMEGHDDAHRWLELLGAVREASLEDYGANRKVYHCYSWTKSRLEDVNVCWTLGTKSAENACASSSSRNTRPTDTGRSGSECGGRSGEAEASSDEGAQVYHIDGFAG